MNPNGQTDEETDREYAEAAAVIVETYLNPRATND